jgi:hypothetical protein
MKMNFKEATLLVEEYLRKSEAEINNFGCALPGYVYPNIKLRIINDQIKEYDFGWVFYYNSDKYLESKDINDMLVGNVTLIVDRNIEAIIETGTAHNSEYYINNYIITGNPHQEA